MLSNSRSVEMSVSKLILCKYCLEQEDKYTRPCLECQECGKYVHKHCLKSLGTPGDFLGDIFFIFTCFECSSNNSEIFVRQKMQWLNVVALVLYNLTQKSPGISNRGYFHWRTHISSYIDKHWALMFGKTTKRKKNWMGTVSGILSHFSNTIFLSGSSTLIETGWWKLAGGMSPASIAQMKAKQPTSQSYAKAHNEIKNVSEANDSDDVIPNTDNMSMPSSSHDIIPSTSSQLNNELFGIPTKMYKSECKSIFAMPSIFSNPEDDSISDLESSMLQNLSDSYERSVFNSVTLGNSENWPNVKTEDVYDDSQSLNAAVKMDQTVQGSVEKHISIQSKRQPKIKRMRRNENSRKMKTRNNVNQSMQNSLNSFPWDSDEEVERRDSSSLVPLNEYEELNLLKEINSILQNNKLNASKSQIFALRRLRAKLNVRRIKRQKGLKLFDVDDKIKELIGFPSENSLWKSKHQMRILDRFQNTRNLLCGTTIPSYLMSGVKLIYQWEAAVFQSPYSGRFLKPYIRRDNESRPLWLNVMNEMLKKANKKNPNFNADTQSSIDYCYVQPQHVSALSSLCSQFFWPGVDLTEILQYPDFTCVALYKKLVIGFACLVPDVDFNTAYLSFLLTRPEWRRSGIATFMLYHLLQTCTDKDVILHVSATNPAIFLYQKFGFKIEEMVQDFYDKYFDITSKECKHALLLRLTR